MGGREVWQWDETGLWYWLRDPELHFGNAWHFQIWAIVGQAFGSKYIKWYLKQCALGSFIFYLLLLELFKMQIFRLCSSTMKDVFFSHLSLPHYHKTLLFKTPRTSAKSLKVWRQWELATVENQCTEGQVAVCNIWQMVRNMCHFTNYVCIYLVIVFVAIDSLILCLSLGYARYNFFCISFGGL